jgi:hypothetical protein
LAIAEARSPAVNVIRKFFVAFDRSLLSSFAEVAS